MSDYMQYFACTVILQFFGRTVKDLYWFSLDFFLTWVLPVFVCIKFPFIVLVLLRFGVQFFGFCYSSVVWATAVVVSCSSPMLYLCFGSTGGADIYFNIY